MALDVDGCDIGRNPRIPFDRTGARVAVHGPRTSGTSGSMVQRFATSDVWGAAHASLYPKLTTFHQGQNVIHMTDMTMEAVQVLLDALTVRELIRAVGTAVFLEQFLTCGRSGIQNSTLRDQTTATIGFFVLFLFARLWLALVSHHVPEPYLVGVLLL